MSTQEERKDIFSPRPCDLGPRAAKPGTLADRFGSDDTYKSGFSFNFHDSDDINKKEDTIGLLEEEVIPPCDVESEQRYALVTESRHAAGGFSLPAGSVVEIDWVKSTINEAYVRQVQLPTTQQQNDSQTLSRKSKGFVPLSILRLLSPNTLSSSLPMSKPGVAKFTSAYREGPSLVELDTMFEHTLTLPSQSSSATLPPRFPRHYCQTPLTIEPSLESFIWPFTRDYFMQSVYSKKCLVIHSAFSRLKQIRNEYFDGFNVDRMLEVSPRVVVWMKDKLSNQMQYVDANPQVGSIAYRSGHSLYFNPPQAVQDAFILALAKDLGCDFGSVDKLGGAGDIEVFAVNTRHTTSWHRDAQENLSIQIYGRKKWTVVRPRDEESSPMSNLHPHSSNRKSVINDRCVAIATDPSISRMCSHPNSTTLGNPTTALESSSIAASSSANYDNHPDAQSFVVRPGTIFYHPAGTWHKVEAIDDEGSLSINLSIDTMRWIDLIMSRLPQLLWSRSLWRKRVSLSILPSSPSPLPSSNDTTSSNPLNIGTQVVSTLLSDLKQAISSLLPQDFLTPTLLLDGRPPTSSSLSLPTTTTDSDNGDSEIDDDTTEPKRKPSGSSEEKAYEMEGKVADRSYRHEVSSDCLPQNVFDFHVLGSNLVPNSVVLTTTDVASTNGPTPTPFSLIHANLRINPLMVCVQPELSFSSTVSSHAMNKKKVLYGFYTGLAQPGFEPQLSIGLMIDSSKGERIERIPRGDSDQYERNGNNKETNEGNLATTQGEREIRSGIFAQTLMEHLLNLLAHKVKTERSDGTGIYYINVKEWLNNSIKKGGVVGSLSTEEEDLFIDKYFSDPKIWSQGESNDEGIDGDLFDGHGENPTENVHTESMEDDNVEAQRTSEKHNNLLRAKRRGAQLMQVSKRQRVTSIHPTVRMTQLARSLANTTRQLIACLVHIGYLTLYPTP